MKKIKILIFLVLGLCLLNVLVVNISAQSSKILATTGTLSLKQSDLDKTIEFFEWAFQTRFKAPQRKKFQTLKIKQFQNDPEGIKKGLDDMINVFNALRSKDEIEQERIRQSFKNDFIEHIRTLNNAESKLLLSVYDGAQDSEQKQTENLSIYGKWFRSTGGGFIDYTGKTNYKSGESFYFEFFPDGTVEYTKETDVLSIMQCKIKGQDKGHGKFSISGNTLTINLGPVQSFETNSCNSKENFNKMIAPSSIVIQFQIRKMESLTRPDNPPIMCFSGKDDVCYERVSK